MHFSTMASKEGVPKASTAAPQAAAMASTSSSSSSSGSMAPMWKPVTPSFTVSTRPPVVATTGTVPYCMAWSWIRPQGSNRDGTSMKSAPAVIMCASGVENLAMPTALPGHSSSSCSRAFSIDFLPVPSTTTWHSCSSTILGMASSMMSTPFCSSRRPMNPKSGTSGSTGRPASACKASLAAALPSNTVASSYGTSRYLSFRGFQSVSSMPLTMPSTPARASTSLSSTPFSSSAVISRA
mmetsp:Transcript_11706/g.32895  ORF Transcript_11706/g.32895 Transcript_11706/m.32895 type:complete len:239 (-) Transcript_11706:762-1478(-)